VSPKGVARGTVPVVGYGGVRDCGRVGCVIPARYSWAMVTKRKGAPQPKRTNLRLDTIGQWFAAAEPVRKMARDARAALDAGTPEAEVRAQVLEAAEREGLVSVRLLLPSLSRKVLRLPLKKTLTQLADYYIAKAEGRKFGDWTDKLMASIGYDEWLVNYIMTFAQTDEPPAAFDVFAGRVWTQQMGPEGEKSPVVFCVGTPLSDPRELARDFLEQCATQFPEMTWSRYGYNPEAARYFRLNREGLTDAEIAEKELGSDEVARLSSLGPKVLSTRVAGEADRVRKSRERFWKEYLDTLADELSG